MYIRPYIKDVSQFTQPKPEYASVQSTNYKYSNGVCYNCDSGMCCSTPDEDSCLLGEPDCSMNVCDDSQQVCRIDQTSDSNTAILIGAGLIALVVLSLIIYFIVKSINKVDTFEGTGYSMQRM